MKFRKDINGLRALAVIAVVLFHFNASWVPGGFAGVDVFFVISGFLMTGIIFKGIEQENFSVLKFYTARANRIIPAMALLCLALLAFGWFYLAPLEYRFLGKHVASSVGFISNFIYWTEAGYFDATSYEKWLLHTWSLSVEWQFYIVYPLMLVGMRKFISIQSMKITILLGTLFGFIFCAFASYKWPSASYYLLPARSWEMMMGGVAYLYPFSLRESRKKYIEWIGLILVIGSYFLISPEHPWPGILALVPVMGSFLIIQAQRDNSAVTSNIIFQKLGSWSYSIYLWHWPLVVIIYTFSLSEKYIYPGMLLSVLLGFLSYKYVERINFRNDFSGVKSYLTAKPIYIVGLMALMGSFLYVKYEALTPVRFTSDQMNILVQQERDSRYFSCGAVENGISPMCIYGRGPVKAIVIGDSHAQFQNVAIGNKASLLNGSILSLSLSGCPTIKDVYQIEKYSNNPNHNCGKMISNAIKITSEQYPNVPIIIINRISSYFYGANEDKNTKLTAPINFVDKVYMQRDYNYANNLATHMVGTICEFAQNNPVYLVRPTPEIKYNVPAIMFRSLTLNHKKSITLPYEEYLQRQKAAFAMQDKAARQCGAKILDPIPYLCDDKFCYGDLNGTPLYADDDHLSHFGAEVISPIYDEVFQ